MMSVTLSSVNFSNGVAYYTLDVSVSGESWTVQKRYSEFRALMTSLLESFPAAKLDEGFPAKRAVASGVLARIFSDSAIEIAQQRQADLQSWLAIVFAKIGVHHPALVTFLEAMADAPVSTQAPAAEAVRKYSFGDEDDKSTTPGQADDEEGVEELTKPAYLSLLSPRRGALFAR